MSNLSIKGILFDKDGTLIEFISVWHGIIAETFKNLKSRYGVSENSIIKIKKASGYLETGFSKESIIQYYSTSQIIELWADIIAKEDAITLSYEESLEVFEAAALSENVEIPVLEGVKELLTYLKAKGYILGVATADSEKSTLHSLEKAGILSWFDCICCDQEGARPKPAPDMAVRFCEAMKLSPSEVLMVGDSITDMQFAQNAKMQFVGIKACYNNYEQYSKNGMPAVDKIGDIVSLFSL